MLLQKQIKNIKKYYVGTRTKQVYYHFLHYLCRNVNLLSSLLLRSFTRLGASKNCDAYISAKKKHFLFTIINPSASDISADSYPLGSTSARDGTTRNLPVTQIGKNFFLCSLVSETNSLSTCTNHPSYCCLSTLC